MEEDKTNFKKVVEFNESYEVPIIIICYNNYKYVENMVRQIEEINKNYLPFIKILNNNSNDIDTINYLKNTPIEIIYNKENITPRVNEKNNIHTDCDTPLLTFHNFKSIC